MIYSDIESIAFRKLDRRALLDVLSDDEQSALFAQGAFDSPMAIQRFKASELRKGELLVVWRERDFPADKSLVIITRDEEYLEFLAWCTTYVGTFVPFTAFFRVLRHSDLEKFKMFDARRPTISQITLDKMAGIAIAEAAVQTAFRTSKPSNISIQSCQLTFSFAVLRGLNDGLHPAQLIELADAWTTARRTSSDRPLPLDADRAMTFWLLACSALIEDDFTRVQENTWMGFISSLIKSTVRTGKASWQGIDANYRDIREIVERYENARELPREQQLRVLDDCIKVLRQHEYPTPLLEAILGYMMARLSNGSFDYLSLAGEQQAELPCSALWFAFFAIWQKDFDGLTAGSSLGRHLTRYCQSVGDDFSLPRADIALQEYLFVSDRKVPAPLRSASSSTVFIELLPGVSSAFPNAVRRDDDVPKAPTSLDVPRLSRILREALELLERQSKGGREPQRDKLDDLFTRSDRGTIEKPKKPFRRKKV